MKKQENKNDATSRVADSATLCWWILLLKAAQKRLSKALGREVSQTETVLCMDAVASYPSAITTAELYQRLSVAFGIDATDATVMACVTALESAMYDASSEARRNLAAQTPDAV